MSTSHYASQAGERADVGSKEWEAWRKVCRQLRALGAVTDEDLKSPPSRLDTPGCALLVNIRAWGEAKSELDENRNA